MLGWAEQLLLLRLLLAPDWKEGDGGQRTEGGGRRLLTGNAELGNVRSPPDQRMEIEEEEGGCPDSGQ